MESRTAEIDAKYQRMRIELTQFYPGIPDLHLLHLARAAYDDTGHVVVDHTHYQRMSLSETVNLEGVFEDDTGLDVSAFKTPTQHIVLAFRGTESGRDENRADWKDNVQSIRTLSDQSRQAQLLTSRVTEAYGIHRVVLTGHSLGGGVAKCAGLLESVPTVGFNSRNIYEDALEEISVELGYETTETMKAACGHLIREYETDGDMLAYAENHVLVPRKMDTEEYQPGERIIVTDPETPNVRRRDMTEQHGLDALERAIRNYHHVELKHLDELEWMEHRDYRIT